MKMNFQKILTLIIIRISKYILFYLKSDPGFIGDNNIREDDKDKASKIIFDYDKKFEKK